MRNRCIWLLAAVAAATLGLRPAAARADFSYGTTVTATDSGSQTNTSLTIDDVNGGSPTTDVFATPANVKVATLTLNNLGVNIPSTTDTYLFKAGDLSVHVTIANVGPPGGAGTGTITLTNTADLKITVTSTSSGLVFSTDSTSNPFGSASNSAVIGGVKYTVQAVEGQQYQTPGAPPNGTTPAPGLSGGFAFRITSSAIPEPGSMALLGIGVVGALGLYRRRTARS